MRTDSQAFRERIEARRTRIEERFVEPTGRAEVCNVGVPTRSRDEPRPAGADRGTPADASDQEAIRAARSASNEAIARHDASATSTDLPDVGVIPGVDPLRI